ncbi:hypothetical protein NLU13_6378 [Sarocladium strictum]|uniref:Uncharacterized protein n=1 Tax=Sarocladium strictum TaxID=5046 RepID=A0AA39GFS9_SARSR|nr:hypothetical protein NLU13_6378 [Sarocladium strictum]
MATSTTSAHAETITPAMRDRQARGKNPYTLEGEGPYSHADDGSGDGDFIWEQGQRVRKHHETWEQKERTNFATRVLGNPDLLLWHAQAKGDSVTAQRLRFTAMLCGYDDYYETHPQKVVLREQQQHQQQQHHQHQPPQQQQGGGSGASAPGARR